MKSFKNLEVWQRARVITSYIYKLTGEFPEDERFGLVSQLRRAAVSICSNIAEGSGRISPKDQKHFYAMAFGSLSEILCQLIISLDLKYIEPSTLTYLEEEIDIIGRQLSKLSTAIDTKLSTINHKP